MLATQATNLSKWDEKLKASAEEEYESFRNVLEWTEDFGLVFVQCAPVQGEELITKVTKDLTTKKIAVLSFQSGEEIRNLYDLVDQMPNRDQIDILFIRGLEYSLVPYIKPGYGGQGDYYKLDNLPPILGHLNLQRERFRKDFGICFVFLLPFFGIKYFIQRAPDFFDWRSGLFDIISEENLLKQATYRILFDSSYDDYSQWNFNQCIGKILEIETLIKEDFLSKKERSALFFEQGNIWVIISAFEEAINSYNNALKYNENHHKTWLNRGIALGDLGRYEEAIASYDNALKIKPDDYETQHQRKLASKNLITKLPPLNDIPRVILVSATDLSESFHRNHEYKIFPVVSFLLIGLVTSMSLALIVLSYFVPVPVKIQLKIQPSPSPITTGVTPIISRESAIELIKNWLNSKNKIFGYPYDRTLANKFLTGMAYEDAKKSINWLEKNSASYTYGIQKIDSVEKFISNGNQASIVIKLTEKRTLTYEKDYRKRENILDEIILLNYDLKLVNGDLKISNYYRVLPK
jgi:tetratricopeptide (TPR) repeat protein